MRTVGRGVAVVRQLVYVRVENTPTVLEGEGLDTGRDPEAQRKGEETRPLAGMKERKRHRATQ